VKLTVLGCWAPYPRAGGACSGYLIRSGGLNVLLDAGNGTLSALMRLIDFRMLDAVIISHLHHDHYLDLFSLRHAIEGARRDGSREAPLKLFAPSEPAADFKLLAGYEKAFITAALESLPVENTPKGLNVRRLELGSLTFRFVPALHPLPGYSISIEDNHKLVFSGDSAPTKELTALAEGADLFLCEASGLDSDTEAMRGIHLTARQAGETAREAGAERLLLTHFWPEYDLSLLSKQAEEGFSGVVSLAREGETHRV